METLFIVMPAYNEEENIEEVIRSWYPILEGKSEKSRLVVADSGSKDRTHAILEELRNGDYPQLEILYTSNQYHGPKLIALYKHAISEGADYIFQTDSDGQTDPAEFGSFWKARKKYAGIFGNRKVRGDGKDRAFVEKVVCGLLHLYFGIKVPDANAPFRLMKAQTVAKYIDKLPKDYNLPNIMMTTYFAYYKEPIAFKTITFKPRHAGVNSINIPRIVKIGWEALGDFYTLRKNM